MNTIRNNSHPNDPARMTDEELKKISKRSMTYWFEDGLTEIVVGGLFLLFIGYRSLIYRFYAVGALSILLGTALSVSGVGNLIGTGILLIVIGAALLCSGGFTLRTYLKLPSPDHPTE